MRGLFERMGDLTLFGMVCQNQKPFENYNTVNELYELRLRFSYQDFLASLCGAFMFALLIVVSGYRKRDHNLKCQSNS